MEFLQALDLGTLFWFGSVHRPWLDAVMATATELGRGRVLIVVVALAALGFVIGRQYRAALLIVLAGLGSYLLSEAVKHYIQRPRPDVSWQPSEPPDPYSFPSGHSLSSMAIYSAAALLAGRRMRRQSQAAVLIAAAVALAMLVGVSRMYLGFHYLTDVVGGWTAGLACALLTMWVDKRWALANPVTVPLAGAEYFRTGATVSEHVRASSDQVSEAR
jgi:undecaprenyl-diphosphatase